MSDEEVTFNKNFLDTYDEGMKEFQNKNYLRAHIILRSNDIKNYYEAQYWIGYMYFLGLGTEQNYEIAADYFLKSAKQGYKNAYHMLYLMYKNGLYFEKNKDIEQMYYNLYNTSN